MQPFPPAPTQEKTFTHSWIKWLIKVKENIEDVFTRLLTAETNITTLEATVAAIPTSMINLIQTVSSTIGSGTASKTHTITAVDTTKTVIIPTGNNNTSVTDTISDVRIELTNSTTVTVYRNLGSSGTFAYAFQVVEYV